MLNADAGVLQPLVVGAAEYGRRTAVVLSAMASDLLGRIELDRQDVRLALLASHARVLK